MINGKDKREALHTIRCAALGFLRTPEGKIERVSCAAQRAAAAWLVARGIQPMPTLEQVRIEIARRSISPSTP